MKKIRFVWRYVRPYRYQFVLILLDVAVYSLFMLAAPLIISWMIDNVIKGVPFDNAFLQQLVDMAGGNEGVAVSFVDWFRAGRGKLSDGSLCDQPQKYACR